MNENDWTPVDELAALRTAMDWTRELPDRCFTPDGRATIDSAQVRDLARRAYIAGLNAARAER